VSCSLRMRLGRCDGVFHQYRSHCEQGAACRQLSHRFPWKTKRESPGSNSEQDGRRKILKGISKMTGDEGGYRGMMSASVPAKELSRGQYEVRRARSAPFKTMSLFILFVSTFVSKKQVRETCEVTVERVSAKYDRICVFSPSFPPRVLTDHSQRLQSHVYLLPMPATSAKLASQ